MLQDVCAENFKVSGSGIWLTRRVASGVFRSPWACGMFLIDTSTHHCRSRRPGRPISNSVSTRPCPLRREGLRIHQKKTRRIYRELGLQLRHKVTKRR